MISKKSQKDLKIWNDYQKKIESEQDEIQRLRSEILSDLKNRSENYESDWSFASNKKTLEKIKDSESKLNEILIPQSQFLKEKCSDSLRENFEQIESELEESTKEKDSNHARIYAEWKELKNQIKIKGKEVGIANNEKIASHRELERFKKSFNANLFVNFYLENIPLSDTVKNILKVFPKLLGFLPKKLVKDYNFQNEQQMKEFKAGKLEKEKRDKINRELMESARFWISKKYFPEQLRALNDIDSGLLVHFFKSNNLSPDDFKLDEKVKGMMVLKPNVKPKEKKKIESSEVVTVSDEKEFVVDDSNVDDFLAGKIRVQAQ